MTNQIDEKVLSKIQKLMATVNDKEGASESEIQSAMLMVQKLLAKNGLEMSDLEYADKDEKEVVDESFTDFKKTQQWEKSLALVISENFRCTSYISKKMTGHRYAVTRLCFVGLKQDVEIAKMVYNYAHEMLAMLTEQFIKDNDYSGKTAITTAKNEYRLGFIQGLKAKFDEQVQKEGWGLILVQDDAVVERVENMGLRAGYRSRAQNFGDSGARAAGYREGKAFEAGKNRLGGQI
jgi:hypothetical protein